MSVSRSKYSGVIILKRIIAGVTAALLAVILVFSFSAEAVSAKSAILMDCTSGRILFNKEPDKRSLIASTTKIMTAILVCEQCNVLDRMRIPKEAVGIEGSSMYLQEGEILTIQELLYGMMLHSGNDAAVALALYCGGTLEGFVQMMNDKAKTLGLTNTHFENPNGLDGENHYSSARDLALLASYAMKNPIFSKIVSTKNIKVGDRYLRNHNKLLWQLEGAEGVKTGYTKAAGRILVSSTVRMGRRLVAVTIHDPNDWQDHAQLINDAFLQYEQKEIISKNQILGYAEIAGGAMGRVSLLAAEQFCYCLSPKEKPEIYLSPPGFVYAPVAKDQCAGFAQIYLNNHWIGNVEMIYGQTVEQDTQPEPGFWKRLRRGDHT